MLYKVEVFKYKFSYNLKIYSLKFILLTHKNMHFYDTNLIEAILMRYQYDTITLNFEPI